MLQENKIIPPDGYVVIYNAYVEDCQFEDGSPVDGRYSYILIPKENAPRK